MSSSLERGRRLVSRMVAFQAGCVAVVALVFLPAGVASAQAAAAGGMIVVAGTALFGWRLFAAGIAPAGRVARALYVAETLKWVWTVVALWAAIAVAGLTPLPLILGLIAAQVAFWMGLLLFR